ncbi:MAG TPA: sugar ABC transporter substrate-binding protein [Mycobacteriales bacterium]|nr:sugar ABC transporter substrate-binding protein [Mycobacteriales bacterium]
MPRTANPPIAGVSTSRRRVLAAGAALAAAATLEACGSTVPQGEPKILPAGAPVSGNLTLYFQGSADEIATWDSLFAQFRKTHPRVHLKAINNVGPDWTSFFANLQIKIAGGQDFDLIYLPTEGQRLFAGKGLIQNIDPWLKRDAAVMRSLYRDIDRNLLATVKRRTSSDGKNYYLPYGFNTMVVWYRKSLFRKAKIPMPRRGWTWDDYLTAARALRDKAGVRALSTTPEYFAGIEPWILTNGTDLLNEEWTASRAGTPEVKRAVEFNRTLIAEDLAGKPGGISDPLGQFAAGEIGMVGFGRWPITLLRANKVDMDDFGLVDWPIRQKLGSPVGWGSLPILKTSKNKNAAWEFVKFMLSDEVQRTIARDALSGVVPARRSFAVGKDILFQSPPDSPVVYNAVSYASALPAPYRENLIEANLDDALRQVYIGASSTDSAMDRLNKTIEQALAS